MSNEQNVVHVTIDGQHVAVPSETTVLEAAETLGIHIPRLCHHPHLTDHALCRLCVVEWEGARTLVPACVAKVREGAVIHTNSERVQRARRTILELLFSAVDLSDAPDLVAYAQEVGADPFRFEGGERPEYPIYDDNPFYIRDYNKCVMCNRCVQACGNDIQFTYALTASGRGFHTRVDTFFHAPLPDTTCVFCGNCVAVCPTGALVGKMELEIENSL